MSGGLDWWINGLMDKWINELSACVAHFLGIGGETGNEGFLGVKNGGFIEQFEDFEVGNEWAKDYAVIV
ncbi:MAG TPA: hypothetical protein VGY56_02335 [Verrucomicrobiae bacterium]|nr:hypothetical protein [Verrucomicrobiae bacterium]